MTSPSPSALLAAGALALALGCGGSEEPPARESESGTASDLRTTLLNPDAPAWRERAPENFTARFHTSEGVFDVEVTRAWAPLGADRFYNLARHGFYDDSRFFRVVAGFIAQFGIPGDPTVTAAWSGRTLLDDPVTASNVRGSMAYAMTGPNTRHTQIYINLVDNVRLDSTGFAPFGRVIEGMGVVDALYSGLGEDAGGGMRGGDQSRMLSQGNAHLDADFPQLSRILRIEIDPGDS